MLQAPAVAIQARPTFVSLDPRQALIPFAVFFYWPILTYLIIRASMAVVVFVLGAAVAFAAMSGRPRWWADQWHAFLSVARSPVVYALAVLLSYFALTQFWAHPNAPALDRAIKVAGTVALAIAVFATAAPHLAVVPRRLLVSGLLIIAVVATADALAGYPLRAAFPVVGWPGFVNFPVVTLAILAFPIAGRLAGGTGFDRALVGAVFLAATVAAVAGSILTALMAILYGVLVAAVAHFIGVRRAAVILAAITVISGLATPILLPNLDTILGPRILEALSAGWAAERVTIWETVANEVRQHWLLGQGFDSLLGLGYRYGQENWPLGHAHNLFLQVWAEGGLIGVSLLLVVAVIAIDRLSRLPGPRGVFGLGWAGAVIAVYAFDFGPLQSWMHGTVILTGLAVWAPPAIAPGEIAIRWLPRRRPEAA